MLKNLIVLPEAEADVAKAYFWYEEQELGLGEEFLHRIEACIQLIRQNPEMYQVVHESYRRAIVRRFPYVVFYEYSDTTATVYAVFHCAQNPEKWRRQLL